MKEETTAPIVGLISEAQSNLKTCFETLSVLDGTPAHPAPGEELSVGVVPAMWDDLVSLASDLSTLSERLSALKNIIM